MDDIAIKVEHVSKTFKLPHEKSGSLKNALINFTRHKKGYERQHVLKGISFEIKKGEFFGIVGRNGSGKSTLLKLLAGIYTPDAGNIQINGKLTTFIELGVGFNPELTGRENVFLNGALLGFNRKEMQAMYKDIVDFAELERFMDQKLKNYSSGMQVRLAFSIAIRAQSDILVLDEVLAVGDEAFQRKCINIFEKHKAKKQTVILVTHDMETVRRFCSRALLLDVGIVQTIGNPRVVAAEYSALNLEQVKADLVDVQKPPQNSNLKLQIVDTIRTPKVVFKSGETMHVRLTWPKKIMATYAGIAIIKQSGEYVFGANTRHKKLVDISSGSIEYEVQLDIGPGQYYLAASIADGSSQSITLSSIEEGPSFIIQKADNNDASVGGLAILKHSWITTDLP